MILFHSPEQLKGVASRDRKTQNILTQLYEASRYTRECLLVPAEYTEISEEQEIAEGALKAALTPGQWALWERLRACLNQRNGAEEYAAFQAGILIGIRLMQFALS